MGGGHRGATHPPIRPGWHTGRNRLTWRQQINQWGMVGKRRKTVGFGRAAHRNCVTDAGRITDIAVHAAVARRNHDRNAGIGQAVDDRGLPR